MRSLFDFWAATFWGWAFGKPGSRYTIVKGKHIGLDMARTGEIPALFGGAVVRVKRTGAMAWVVVLDTGLPGAWRYHSYCHLAFDDLPNVGDWIPRGERVGRVALGSDDSSSPEWGGTAWDGRHLHFVVGGHPESAYYEIAGHRTLSAFTDPTILIREALAAPSGGGYTPFDPEEDAMPTHVKHIDTRPRKLAKGTWQNLYLNAKDNTSFASGRCIVQSTAVVQLAGLPKGAEIQFRLVTTKAGTNQVRSGTTVREAVATSGTTYATVADSIELTLPDDGVRWQYAVLVEGAEVKRTEVSAVIHRAD